jgi:hypothetical protein
MGPAALATFAGALQMLTERLGRLDYPVTTPVVPCPALEPALTRFARAGIEVPPALALLWRDIGAICSSISLDIATSRSGRRITITGVELTQAVRPRDRRPTATGS